MKNHIEAAGKKFGRAKENLGEAVVDFAKDLLADSKRLRKENALAFWTSMPIATALFFVVPLGQPVVIAVYFGMKPKAAKKFLNTVRGKKPKHEPQGRTQS